MGDQSLTKLWGDRCLTQVVKEGSAQCTLKTCQAGSRIRLPALGSRPAVREGVIAAGIRRIEDRLGLT